MTCFLFVVKVSFATVSCTEGTTDDTETCLGDTEAFSFSFVPETRVAPSTSWSSCSLCCHCEADLNSSKLLFSRSWLRVACGILVVNIPAPARWGAGWLVGNCTYDDNSDDKHCTVLVMTMRMRMTLTLTMMMTLSCIV